MFVVRPITLGARGKAGQIVFSGGSKIATRSYSSSPLQEGIDNLLDLTKYVLTGQRPKFPRGEMQDYVSQAKYERETVRQFNSYKQQSEATGEILKKVAKEYATRKDLEKALAALIVCLLGLYKLFTSADDELKKIEEEAKAEIRTLQEKIKNADLTKEEQEAALKELDDQYQSWTDWWQGITEQEKIKCRNAISKAAAAHAVAEKRIAEQKEKLVLVEQVREARNREREAFILSVD